jgi:hypothetical protein
MTSGFLPYEVGALKPHFYMQIISVISWNFLEVSVLASDQSFSLGHKKGRATLTLPWFVDRREWLINPS